MADHRIPPLSPSSHAARSRLRSPQYALDYRIENDNEVIDFKLSEQFKYFRNDFMSAAVRAGATIPLDMAGEAAEELNEFIKSNSPKYIFQIMQNNFGQAHLIRAGLSLLLVLIAILKRMLGAAMNQTRDGVMYGESAVQAGWALEALAKVAVPGSVHLCIDLLVGAHIASIQELALNLLAVILSISEEAAAQMLQPPYNMTVGSIGNGERDRERERLVSSGSKRPGTAQSEPEHPLTTKLDYSKFSFKFNTREYTKAKPPRRKPADPFSSCLSYVLAVVMLEKNRHLLSAGCADVILAMMHIDAKELSEVIARTPTCALPIVDAQSSPLPKGSNRVVYIPQPGKTLAINPLTKHVVEWAGLKLLLKFLHRFQKIIQPRLNSLPLDSISAALSLKDEYAYAHLRILTAVCTLISSSSVVAAYVHGLPGATRLIEISLALYEKLPEPLAALGSTCLRAVRHEAAKQRRGSFGASSHGIRSVENNLDSAERLPFDSQPSAQIIPGTSKFSGTGLPDHSCSQRQTVGNWKEEVSHLSVDQSSTRSAGPRPPVGSAPEVQSLHKDLHLSSHILLDFKSEFQVETDQEQLFNIHNYEQRLAASKELSSSPKRSKKPPGYDPTLDKFFDASLNSIDQATNRPIIDFNAYESAILPPHLLSADCKLGDKSEDKGHEKDVNSVELDADSRSAGDKDAQNSTSDSTSTVGGLYFAQSSVERVRSRQRREEERLLKDKGASRQAKHSSSSGREVVDDSILSDVRPSVQRDLFNKLPAKPFIPKRIEPRDVIKKDEELSRMRDRYNALAANAINLLHKKGYMRNGKFSVPIEERARRIYKNKFDDYSQNPTLSSANASRQSMSLSENGKIVLSERQKSVASELELGVVFPFYGENDEFKQQDDDADLEDFSFEPPSVYGLRLDQSIEFDEDRLLEDMKPIFDLPVRKLVPLTHNQYDDVEFGTSGAKYGRKLNSQLEITQSVDLLLP